MRPRPVLALVAILIPACAGPVPRSERAEPEPPAATPAEPAGPSTPTAPAGPPAEPASQPSAGELAAAGTDPAPASAEPAPAEPPPWEGSAEVESNAGSYLVRYRPAPDPIPWGQPFALEVWVLDAAGQPRPARDAALSVDAAMPEHGHGMNRVPEVTRAGDGFRVAGMLFHMPGRWELYLDVTQGALTERAQLEVMLD